MTHKVSEIVSATRRVVFDQPIVLMNTHVAAFYFGDPVPDGRDVPSMTQDNNLRASKVHDAHEGGDSEVLRNAPSASRGSLSALARIGWPLRVDAFNSVAAGEIDFTAMIVRDDEPGCSSILAQQLSDQMADDIVKVVGEFRELNAQRPRTGRGRMTQDSNPRASEAVREALVALERRAVALYRGIAPGGNYGANTEGSDKNESTFADADEVVAQARAALALPQDRAGGEVQIPKGMKRWDGGDIAPTDWDGGIDGPVLLADGEVCGGWHGKNWATWDLERTNTRRIIAYTPKPTPAPASVRADALEEARLTLDVFLAAYDSEPDDAMVNADDDLLTWGHLRTILKSFPVATPKQGTGLARMTAIDDEMGLPDEPVTPATSPERPAR